LRGQRSAGEAERLITQAVTLSPRSARYRNELAEILQLQGRDEEAQAELEKARMF
jgi:Flp pilus assembly protein TadD